MSLKHTLNKPSVFFTQLTNRSFEDPLQIIKERIMLSFAQFTPKQPDQFDLRIEYEKARAAYETDVSVDHLSKRTLRMIPWLLFSPPDEALTPLADIPGFLNSYLQTIYSTGYEKCWCILFYILMLKYPVSHSLFPGLLISVRNGLSVAHEEKGKNLYTKSQQFYLLAQDGPDSFIHNNSYEKSFNQSLSLAGLTGELQTGQFAFYAYKEWLGVIQQQIQSTTNPLEFIQQVLTDSVTEDHQFIFASCKNALVEALLLPFANRSASDAIRKLLKEFIFLHFKDPRMDSSRWVNISTKAKDVFLSWLVESTLHSFFQLLDYVSRSDATADRHWTYRKAFWSAYLRHGMIDEAWLVLGPDAYDNAKHFLSDETEYGRFIRGGGVVLPNHSTLIIRIGSLVITEWSHVGSYRLWQSFHDRTPKFYKVYYKRSDLVTLPMIEDAHRGSENGNWQNKLARTIQDHTGIEVSSHEYMRIER